MTRRGFLTVLAYLNDFLITADSERKWEIVYHELIRWYGQRCDVRAPKEEALAFIETNQRKIRLPLADK